MLGLHLIAQNILETSESLCDLMTHICPRVIAMFSFVFTMNVDTGCVPLFPTIAEDGCCSWWELTEAGTTKGREQSQFPAPVTLQVVTSLFMVQEQSSPWSQLLLLAYLPQSLRQILGTSCIKGTLMSSSNEAETQPLKGIVRSCLICSVK